MALWRYYISVSHKAIIMREFIEQSEWTKRLKEYFPEKGIKVLTNGEYIVEIHKSSCRWGDSIRLSVKRIDGFPMHSWTDLQEIKNKVAGEERVAIEIYPKNKEKTDTANIYHLWVLPENFELPYGLITYGNGGV